MPRWRNRVLLCTATAALATVPLSAKSEVVVGTAAAVNPTTTAIASTRPSRVIEIGARVVHRERIRTSEKGSVQVIFIDKTSLNIGPNSDIMIDEFVYDPNTNTGRMAATLTKGALRFVGGGTSHTGGATVATPTATIGIRGGVGSISHDSRDGTFVIHHFGITTIATKSAGVQTIRRPDFALRVSPAGEATSPRRVQAADLASITSKLTSARGQSGGASRRPSDQRAVEAGLGRTNRSLVAAATPSVQPQTVASSNLGTMNVQPQQQVMLDDTLRQGAQAEATEATALQVSDHPTPQPPQPKPPQPPPAQEDPPRRFYAMHMSLDPSHGSGAPYLPAGFAAAGQFYNSPVLGFGLGGTTSKGAPNRFSRFLQAGLNVTGQGASQVSTIYVMTGGADSDGFNSFDGGFTATTRRAAGISAGRASGSITGVGADVSFDADLSPLSAHLTQNGFNSAGQSVPQDAFYFPGDGVPGTQYTIRQTATRIGTPAGLGTNRPALTLSGYGAGLMRTFSENSGSAIGGSFPFIGRLGLTLRNDDRFDATIAGLNLAYGGEIPGELATARLEFGYKGSDTFGSRGVYIDYDHFAGRESRATSFQTLSRVNGTAVSDNRALIVSSKTVSPGPTFQGVNLCQCEYTRWGFWSSETNRNIGGDHLQDMLHLGTWVAGRPTRPADMPVTGVATYQGHAIATIKKAGNEYLATGGFVNTVNFGSRSGSVNISGLDGRNYTGAVAYAPGSAAFGGKLTGTGYGSPSMALVGRFYDGPAGPAREMGGLLTINGGASYRGAGIFAASR